MSVVSLLVENAFNFPYGGGPSALQVARDKGYTVAETLAEMDALQSLPALGLFAGGALAFAIDRPSTQPSLQQMTAKALELLTKADTQNKGVMLFVEGSLIDISSHGNDAATMVPVLPVAGAATGGCQHLIISHSGAGGCGV